MKYSDEAQSIGIDSTPTFFVNGKVIQNPQSYEAFKALIEAAASGSSK
jgi:protein-disulfide isomerase